jgi:hypothetical protein
MKGPRGSVRWHQWVVGREVGLAILNDEDEFRKARKEPGRLFLFTTADNLVVALNPQHIVTAMFGDEDTRFLVEQKALTPSLLVSGHPHLPENHTQVLQDVHDMLKRATQELPTQEVDFECASLSEYPGYSDRRPSLAFLRDLKTPFEDHVWHAGAQDRHSETICSQLGAAIHLNDEVSLPTSAAVIDQDQMRTQLLFPLDQTSVLQASRWAVERTSLRVELTTLVEDTENEFGLRDSMSLDRIREDSVALGVFGLDEVEQFVAQFEAALSNAAPKKRRGRKPAAAAEAVDS